MKKLLTIAMAAAMTFSLAACTGSPGSTTAAGSTTPATLPNTTAAATTAAATAAPTKGWSSEHYKPEMKGKTLNMYAVTDSIIPALEVFYQDTGIKVESLTMKNGEMLQRIKNEKDSGTVLADLWFTGGADTFISGSEMGLTMAYKSPEAESIQTDMKDLDGYWTGTSLTVVDWVVNTEVIKELGAKMPETWDDLLQPELKGMISMSDPASSGTAYNTVSAILQTKGEEEGWKYLDQLIQQVPFFTARGSDPINLAQTGEAALGIAAGTGATSMAEGTPEHVKLVYPKDGTGWWPQPLAIIEGTKNPEEAKVFVDWALSKRGLEEIGKCQRALLVKADVPAPKGIMALNEIKLFPTDFKANAKDRDAILVKWAEKVKAADKVTQ